MTSSVTFSPQTSEFCYFRSTVLTVTWNINLRQKLYESVIFYYIFFAQRRFTAVESYHEDIRFNPRCWGLCSQCPSPWFLLLSCLYLTFSNRTPFPQAVMSGIVRGAGKQTVGAVCNFVGFYIIGLPIGASLMFPVKMGFVGEPRSSAFPRIHCIPAWISVLHIYMNTLEGIQMNGLFYFLLQGCG